MTPDKPLRVEVAHNLARLEQIVSAWTTLTERHSNATPFHLPEWLLPWWRHFGSGDLQVLLLWQSDQLLGFVPAFCLDWNGRKQLTLLGSGITDYLEPLISPQGYQTIVQSVMSLPDWDLLCWQDLQSNSSLLDPALWAHLSVTTEPDTACSSILIEGDFASYWQSRGKDLRRNVRRYRDRAALEGPVTFAAESTFDASLMADLISLHAARWQQRGEAGTLAHNHAEAFITEVCQRMDKAGLLRFLVLRWRGQVVAIIVGWLWRNEIFSYLSAFHPDYEQLGFGRILLHEALQYAWAQRWQRWRFLRGEEAYKQHWGAVAESKSRLTVSR